MTTTAPNPTETDLAVYTLPAVEELQAAMDSLPGWMHPAPNRSGWCSRVR